MEGKRRKTHFCTQKTNAVEKRMRRMGDSDSDWKCHIKKEISNSSLIRAQN